MILEQDYEFLLGKLAHELRNPLTTLSSTLQLIECRHPEVKDFAHWSNLSYDLDFLCQIIADFSSLSHGNRLQLSTFEVVPFLEEIADAFRTYADHANIAFSCQFDTSCNQITGDKTKLQEVFTNLLKNAFEASTPEDSVHFSAYISNDMWIVKIQDTGMGIASEHLDSLFDPFVTHKKDGTGLGLPIVQQIIKAHRGTVQVESVLEKGTTFLVCLPANQTGDCHTGQ